MCTKIVIAIEITAENKIQMFMETFESSSSKLKILTFCAETISFVGKTKYMHQGY